MQYVPLISITHTQTMIFISYIFQTLHEEWHEENALYKNFAANNSRPMLINTYSNDI